MGTKSDQFLFEYRLTNTRTGEVFQARGWRQVAVMAGVPSYNAATLKKTKKWIVEIVSEPEEWDEAAYRSTLYQSTKGRYPGYEQRKQLKDPKYETRKRLRIGKYKNYDGTPYTAEQHTLCRDNCCAVCGEEDRSIINVDHCHTTGIVRGPLCRRCNVALGQMKDNPEYIMNLYLYIKDHERKLNDKTN